MKMSSQLHSPTALFPEKEPAPLSVGYEAAVQERKISCPYRESNFGFPAGSQSLHRLSYRDSQLETTVLDFEICPRGILTAAV
jgi:hypothetical protein